MNRALVIVQIGSLDNAVLTSMPRQLSLEFRPVVLNLRPRACDVRPADELQMQKYGTFFIEGLQELFGLRPASQGQVIYMACGHKEVENHCCKGI